MSRGVLAFLICVLLAVLVTGERAAAEESSPSDDAIGEFFGSDTDEEDPAERLFEDLDVDSALEDRLTIGGLLQLRLDTFAFKGADPEDTTVASPNLLDLYFDARPSDRVRGYAAFRYEYDPTVETDDGTTPTTDTSFDLFQSAEQDDLLLDQLWIKFDIARKVYFTVGKQRVKFGAARFFNPTDFVNNVRRDPLAIFDERTGVDLVRLHFPFEELGWNLYLIGDIGQVNTVEEIGGTLRLEMVFGTAEMSLTGQVRKDEPVRLGADISAGVGPFDVYVEAGFRYDDASPFYRGEFDPATLTLPETFTRKDEWLPQVAAGFDFSIKYNDEDSVFIGVEYFFNESGYEDESLYPVLLLTGAYEPLYTGRHYAGVFTLLPSPGQWDDTTFLLSALGNLSDESYLVRFDYTLNFLTYLTFNVYAQYHTGTEGGEFFPGFSFDGNPNLPVGLLPEPWDTIAREGLDVPPPVVDVGLRLAIDL